MTIQSKPLTNQFVRTTTQHTREVDPQSSTALETPSNLEAQGLFSWLFPDSLTVSACLFGGFKTEDMAALAGMFYLLYRADTWKDALAIFAVARPLAALLELPSILVKVSEGLQPQSGGERSSKPWLAVALTLAIAYAMAGAKGVPMLSSKCFWQAPAWRDIASASSLAGPLFSPLVAWTFEAITGAPYLTSELVAHEAKIKNLLDQVEAMDAVGLQDRLHTNPLLCERVMQLESQYFELSKIAPPSAFNTEAPAALQLAKQKILRWSGWVEAAGMGRGAPRTPPLVVRFWGSSGIGKSALGPLLAASTLSGHYSPPAGTNVSSLFYTRAVGSKHWNGYTQQPAVFYDDFGQQADTANSPNTDFYELIQVANSSPLNLEMADLERKARTFFTSPLVILSSNKEFYRVPSVTHEAAVWRRITMDIEVIALRKPDPRTPQGEIDTSIYEFHVGTFESGYREGDARTVTKMNWEELRRETRRRFNARPGSDSARKNQINRLFLEAQGGDLVIPQDEHFTYVYRTKDMIAQHEYEDLLSAFEIETTVDEVAVCELDTGKSYLLMVRTKEPLDIDLPGPLNWLEAIIRPGPLQRIYDRFCQKWAKASGWLGHLAKMFADLPMWQRLAIATTAVSAATVAIRALMPAEMLAESPHERDPRKPVVQPRQGLITAESPHERAPKKAEVHRHGLFSAESPHERQSKQPALEPRKGMFTKQAEMAQDPIARSLAPKLSANVREIILPNGGILGHLFGIFDRFAMLPLHIFHGALYNSTRVFTPQGYKELDFATIEGYAAEADLAVIKLPDSWSPFKDVRKHFVLEADLTITRFQARLIFPRLEKMGKAHISHHKDSYLDPTTQQKVTLTRHVQYADLETEKGDCGAILTHCNPGIARKIIGYHVAGSSTTSVARIITREEIDSILRDLGCDLSAQSGESKLDTRFEVVEVDRPYTFPKSSKLRLSPLAAAFPATKGRAILRTIGEYDPLIIGVNKYANAREVPASEWEPALDIAETLLCFPAQPDEARVLTTEEAVLRWGNLEPMRLDKSSGHPWSRSMKGTKKAVWLDPITDEVQSAIADIKIRALAGETPTEVFIDCLKDEKRSLARCDPSAPQNIKTRVFSIAPLDHVLAMRQYFGAFVSSTIEHRIGNTLTAGIVPQSAEWDKLARHMESVGDNCYDGDWAGFDTTLPASLIQAFGILAERWYKANDPNWTKRDALVREYLMLSTSRSLHHVNGQIIRWHGGLPSGCFGTNQIDSVSNLLIFIRAAQTAGLLNREILSDLRMVFHGDDNLFSAHPNIADRFAPIHVAEYGESIGMKFTAADKGTPGDYKPVSECTFLKRGFTQTDGMYMAPLDLGSITEMVRWTSAPHTDTESFPLVLDTAFVELVIHQSAEAEEVSRVLYAAAREKGFRPNRPTLAEVRLQYFAGMRLERENYNVGPIEALLGLQLNRKGKWTFDNTQNQRTRQSQRLAAQSGGYATPSGAHGATASTGPEARAAAAVPGHTYPMLYSAGVQRPTYIQAGLSRPPTSNRAKRDTGFLSMNAPGGWVGGKPNEGHAQEKGQPGLAAVPEVPDVTGDTQIETVTYIDQVPQQVGDDPYLMRNSRETFALESSEHTLQDIIGRPRPREQFLWEQGQVRGTNIWTLGLPLEIFPNSVAGAEMPALTAKSNQFQYMRATVNVRIALNAMQFHQGRLLLTFNPLETMRGARASNSSLTYETGLKSIQIDPNKHQTVVLSIPLVAPYSHWNLPTSHLDMGLVRLTVMEPLFSAVSTQSVTITPTIYLTDIELSMPTPTDSALIAQMGDGKAPEEASAQKEGVISGPLSSLSTVSHGIAALTAGVFPRISALSEGASWLTSFMSGAARYFGYNKPSSYTGARAYFDTTAYPNHLMDGAAQAVKLGAAQDHDLPVVPGVFGTDVDEMHISYIVSKPNLIQTFAWSQADTVGSTILAPYVFPGASNEFESAANSLSFQTTHTSFVASMFRYWSGSMKYRLALVSTGFHAGRLLITYIPNSLAGLPQILDEFGNAWSMVWDISERNDIEFSVPWCSNMPALQNHLDDVNLSYLQLGTQPNDSGPLGSAEIGEFASQICNGRFLVTVLSQLVNPDTTRSVVDVQLFVSGGPDLEFYQPEISSYVPVTSDLADVQAIGMADFASPVFSIGTRSALRPLKVLSSAQKSKELEAQGAFYQGDPAYPAQSILGREREPNMALFDMTPTGPSLVAELIAGEKITSLRQLIKRHSVVAQFQNLTPASSIAMIDPNHFRIGDANGSTEVLRSQGFSMMDYISSLYAAYRGSQRFAFHTLRSGGGVEETSLGLNVSRLSGVATNRGPGAPSQFDLNRDIRSFNTRTATLIVSRSDRDVEIDVPYTARTPILPVRNRGATTIHNDSSAIFDESAPLVIQLSGPANANSDMVVTRAASDDFSFGLMVGAPVLRKVQYTMHSSTASGQTTIFR